MVCTCLVYAGIGCHELSIPWMFILVLLTNRAGLLGVTVGADVPLRAPPWHGGVLSDLSAEPFGARPVGLSQTQQGPPSIATV